MTEALEFQDVSCEFRGAMCPGRLKITDQNIVFKNKKTGKVDQINGPDLDLVNWQKLVGTWALRIFLKNGSLHRFAGFKESEIEKICSYFKTNFKIDVPEKELSVKGWNWGATKFVGNVLSFDVNNTTAFEVPLKDVSQCTTGKNEVTVAFHNNDDAAESLIEMRFYIPTTEIAGDTDPVEAFKDNVMNQASVISAIGDAIAEFTEIQCLTPRGRYDIKIFNSFFQLHGKTFDYKIPLSTVLRLFTLPHKDGRQNFFVISLDPPIKQGQTRYHFLTLLFNQDETTEITLPFSEKELKEKYEGKLEKELTGPTYEVMAKVMKVIVNRKITVPGSFKGHTGTPAVTCSYKAAAGYIYPLERGFIFIHKPPIHIRFEEIATVNFARSGGSTRSFDFEIELKSGVLHTFSSIEKEEYGRLFDFIREKKLRVKNTGKGDKPNYKEDFGESDDEKEPDAYLARVKREAAERDDDDDEDEDESTDEDFNPDQQESDVAEEYDSNPTPTESEADSDASEGTKKKKKEKSRKTITISEKPRKSKKDKESSGGSSKKKRKKKDKNAPKRPMSAFMLWMNDMRDTIKKDNPGIAFTDIAKKGGELWKNISSKEKAEYEDKAKKAKDDYTVALKAYQESGGGADDDSSDDGDEKSSKTKTSSSEKSSKPKPAKKKESSVAAVSPFKVKSKEFIESDESSSDSDDDKKKSSSKRKKSDSEEDSKAKTKKKKEKSESEEEEEEKPASKSKTKSKKKEESESEEEEDSASEDSDKEKKSKSKGKKEVKGDSKKADEIDDEEYDEPVESTPPSSDAGSDDASDDDD